MYPQQVEPGIESIRHPDQERPATFVDALLIILVFLGSQVVLGLVLGLVAFFTTRGTTAIEYALLEAASVVAALWVVSRRLRVKMTSLLPDKAGPCSFWLAAATGALGASLPMLSIERWLTILLPVPGFLKSVFSSIITPDDLAGSMILAMVVAPIGEEILFRGVMLRGFRSVYGPTKGVLYSALLFGLVHLNPYQFVAGFLLGLFLGFLYVRTDSLVLPVIAHAVYNGGFAALSYLERGRVVAALGGRGATSFLEVAVGLGILALSVWLLLRVTASKPARRPARSVE